MKIPSQFQIAYGSSSTRWFGFGLAAVLFILPLVLIFYALPSGLLTFQITQTSLRITGDPYGRKIDRDDLKLAEARRLDLDVEPNFHPTSRTNGTGLPAYQAGWFNTKGAGKALLFASDWKRAVVVPTKLDYSLILTPENPDQFLADLSKPLQPDISYVLATPPGNPPGVPPGMIWLWIMLIGLPGIGSVMIILITIQSRKVMFVVTDQGLRIKGDLYGRTIPWNALHVHDAALVNLKTGPDSLSLIRTNGVGMPGYGSGWFRDWKLRSSYLLFVTDASRVVRIPTDLGYTLLISPAAPESFLAAIRQS